MTARTGATHQAAQRATPISVAWAIRYANAGLHPIRLAPPEPGQTGTGKRPVESRWQTRPLDVDALCAALERRPASNLGLRMGLQPDGETALVALDIDDMAAAESIRGELGDLPLETLRTSTGRGLHLIYRVPVEALARLSNFAKRSGIDLRAEGAQVVAAPSIHYTGDHYSTVLVPPAELPPAWLDWLIANSRTKAGTSSSGGSHECPARLIRDDRWLEHARADLERLPPAVEGSERGGRALYQAACIAMRGWLLPRDVAEDLLLEDGGWNSRCEPPWEMAGDDRRNWDHTMARADGTAPSTKAWGSSRPMISNAEGYRTAEHPGELAANDSGTAALAHVVSHMASAREQGHDPAVDNLICHLAVPAVGVYQRSGQLVTIVREAVTDGDCVRPDGAPMIRALAHPRLKEIVRMTVGPTYERLVGDVMARGQWEHIRPLDAIATYPVLRRDGSLLLESGYDAATHTLAEIDVCVPVPDEPTRDDARRALDALTYVVQDFPFVGAAHRSAWLAMLLTVPARPAIKGPTPLGLLEASTRGSGKTLLADVLSIIVAGSEVPRRTACKTKEEWDKSMLALLSAGDPLVLIDNVTNMLVSDALDAVLTGTTYTQRVLGVSETRTVAVRTVFLASSNNARLSADLVRRTIACRLVPDVERPEQRTDWTIDGDLLDYVRAHRTELLGATLTILRAYAVAGRPRVDARPMGSYGSWCRVVRDALVWLGEADPAATQDELRETADVEGDELGEMLSAWHALLGERAVTVRELVEAAATSDGTPRPQALYDALAALMPSGAEPTAHAVGNRLRTLRDQIVSGLGLRESRDSHANVRRWRVIRPK